MHSVPHTLPCEKKKRRLHEAVSHFGTAIFSGGWLFHPLQRASFSQYKEQKPSSLPPVSVPTLLHLFTVSAPLVLPPLSYLGPDPPHQTSDTTHPTTRLAASESWYHPLYCIHPRPLTRARSGTPYPNRRLSRTKTRWPGVPPLRSSTSPARPILHRHVTQALSFVAIHVRCLRQPIPALIPSCLNNHRHRTAHACVCACADTRYLER